MGNESTKVAVGTGGMHSATREERRHLKQERLHVRRGLGHGPRMSRMAGGR